MTGGSTEPPADPGLKGRARPPAHSQNDAAAKLQFAWLSYGEALDATKHQDDKVGQLLASVAFLTAATIALAALEPTRVLARRFTVPPFTLPLGLVTLTIFLIGIAFSVMLLLTSLGTPLRVPGLSPSTSGRSRSGQDSLHRASQIYFFDISRFSLDEWQRKWDVSARQLQEERLSSLIKETHNLGVRTSSKYDRTTEAVSLLSVSLLAFALSVVFVGIVATAGDGASPIKLSILQRSILALIIAGYCWIQLLTRVRYDRQAVDEVPQSGKDKAGRRKYLGQVAFTFALPALTGCLLIYESPDPLRLWVICLVLLAAASVISFWFAAYEAKVEQKSIILVRRAVATLLVVILTGVSIASAVEAWYGWQLVIVSFVVLLFLIQSVIAPSLRVGRNRQAYWRRIAAHSNESKR